MGKLADYYIEELQQAARAEYITHNEAPELFDKIDGSRWVGDVTTTFENLVRTFGLPRRVDNEFDGTFYEWVVEFGDGTLVTIYDINMKTPCYTRTAWRVGTFGLHYCTPRVVLQALRQACGEE